MFFLPFQLADSNFGPVEPTSGTNFVQWHYLVPEPSLVLINPPGTLQHEGKIFFNIWSGHNLCISHTCLIHIIYVCYHYLLWFSLESYFLFVSRCCFGSAAYYAFVIRVTFISITLKWMTTRLRDIYTCALFQNNQQKIIWKISLNVLFLN